MRFLNGVKVALTAALLAATLVAVKLGVEYVENNALTARMSIGLLILSGTAFVVGIMLTRGQD